MAQRREIKEMEWLIEDIGERGLARTAPEAERRSVPKFSGREGRSECQAPAD